MTQETAARELSSKLAGPGRQVFVAGALALTEPGPAASGVVIADAEGHVFAHRAQYLGSTTRAEANARALIGGFYLAADSGLEAPVFHVDDRELLDAIEAGKLLPDGAAPLTDALSQARDLLPGHQLEATRPNANLARPVALAPLVEWLPERTRRAEGLHVRSVGDHVYEVESESHPDEVYRVALTGETQDGQPMRCECADFQYRGIPCKHLLAVARETDALEHVFRAQPAEISAARPHEGDLPGELGTVPTRSNVVR